tara:strand:- start:1521 stop:2060 length:540 start_codon:yes stop_codon:yes gene_type:complete
MPNLNKWTEGQLKRGCTKNVRDSLIRPACHKTTTAGSDKIKISSSKKASSKLPLFVGVTIVIILISFFLFTSKPAEPEVNPIQQLCSEFKEAEYTISCERAVALALEDSPGVVEKVSVGPMQISDTSTGTRTFVEETMWMIDITLENPSFFEQVGKEMKSVRIGIGLDEFTSLNRRYFE